MESEHESKPQNPLLVNVLYKQKVLESWGRGIGLMMSECRKAGLPEPEYKIWADKCTLKNCAALWDSMKGRPKHSSRESLWSMQGNSTRRNTDGDLRPKKSGFQVLKALTDGANWFLLLLESPLPSGSKSNSTSYGRAYTDLYSRKGKVGEWRYNRFILLEKRAVHNTYELLFHYICS